MRVFITGATGFIGSAIVQELLGAGHQVLGLARSEAAAEALHAAGAQAHRGSLEDVDSLRRGAAAAEGVIHAGFIHDFANFQACCAIDQQAIEVLGGALAGSDKPFVVTAGLAGLNLGRPTTEADENTSPGPRQSEPTALALAARGVRASVVRLPPSVHGEGDYGFVPTLIGFARAQGTAAYPGEGRNRWPAVHRLDAARLFRLALEQGATGARYHGVADEGVAMRDIAAVIGRHLHLPVVSKSGEAAAAHFGWLAAIAAADVSASSAFTQQALGWQPTQSSLLADLDQGHYFDGKVRRQLGA